MAARVAYVVIESKTDLVTGAFFSQWDDSHLYDTLARNLIDGHGYVVDGRPTAIVPPGYPLFLAACYALLGRDFLLVGLVQSVLGAVVCVAAFATARRVFNDEVAWLAGLTCAVLPELIFWTSGQILTEPLYIVNLNELCKRTLTIASVGTCQRRVRCRYCVRTRRWHVPTSTLQFHES